ncbi:MAG: non-canonical purine NTP pyrophosphatase, partial [Myxococcota bacterium]|nr:non-canonical purine NTP pyrophosphatase [Myxococcota bacterium]
MKPKLIIATGNPGKAKEFRALLGQEIEILTLADFPNIVMPPEDAETFVGNALIKAKFVAETLNVPTLADDSGLVVDALDGAPGVRSARYVEGTDQDRYLALLEAIQDVAKDRRSARFVCAMAFVATDGTSEVVE